MWRLQPRCIMLFSKGWTDVHEGIVEKAWSQANSFPVAVGCVCFTDPFNPHSLCVLTLKMCMSRKEGRRDGGKLREWWKRKEVKIE